MRRAWSFACGVAVLLALSVVLHDGSAGAAPAPDLRQRIELAVVAIEARIGGDTERSSGLVIDPDRGLVLTTSRAVWGATSLKVGTGLGIFHGRIVARAPCDDLALVETHPRIPGLLTLPQATDAPSPGELITSVGRRRADAEHEAQSVLTIPALAAVAPGPNRITLDAPLPPEAFGGPLLNSDGGVIGLTQDPPTDARATAIAWAAIERRLRQLRPAPRRVYAGWRYQYRCIRQLHAKVQREHPLVESRDAWLNAPVRATRLPGTEHLDGE